MNLSELCFPGFDEAAAERCRSRWNSLAKPLGSLGLFEYALARIAGLTGSADIDLSRRGVLVLCADNGIVAQGISQADSRVTAIVARNLTLGRASVCHMARCAGADVIPVDMGMAEDPDVPGLLKRRVAAGTRDISQGPAMTREQAKQAITTGIELVAEAKDRGYRILCTGEMGIGNTSTSAAMASVLLGVPAERTTGRGAGLSTDMLRRKTELVARAIELNAPDSADALDVLSKLGGFDIAGLTGVFLGGAIHGIPVVLDGLISSVAALTAARMFPAARCSMLASHVSAEPAGALLLSALGLKAPISAGMFLGEGTGAVALLPLLDMALAVYNDMSTFSDIEIDSYRPFK